LRLQNAALAKVEDAPRRQLPQTQVDLACWCLVLDELDQHWQVSEVALILDHDLNFFENLQDVTQEQIASIPSSVCARLLRRTILRTTRKKSVITD